MKWNELNEEACPVARSLSCIGDRWTILILRNCFLSVRRFDDFQKSLGITRHVLSERLRKLENMGLLMRTPYQERPTRYEYRLTDAGKEFQPVLLSLMTWGKKHLPSDQDCPFEFYSKDTGEILQPVMYDDVSQKPITTRNVEMRDRKKA